jgi:hypothetical protein
MTNRPMRLWDKLLLRNRTLIKPMHDQRKTMSHIQQSRHRSMMECMVNVSAGLVAYNHRPEKPSLSSDTPRRCQCSLCS